MSISREVDALEHERDELKRLYGRARHDALVDGLTGLGNHRAFQDELARQLEVSKRMDLPLALLLIDVDDLKVVNDTKRPRRRRPTARGRRAGDGVRAAARRPGVPRRRRRVRDPAARAPTSTPGWRWAAGSSPRPSAAATRAQAIERSRCRSACRPIPTPSIESHDLYRNADAALYWCKRHGRTAVVAYDPSRHGAASDDRSVAELSDAIGTVLATRALRPVYQPIFSMTTGRPIGYEGLVRPAGGAPFADASSLFAAAEAADRTVELDLACLETVAAGARLPESDAYLSVNLSPRTLESNLFRVGELKAIFARHEIPLDRVVLELTEREQVEDLDQLRTNVEACRRAGMRLAADDVGAGNAGLRLLSEVHFDIVKIDLSLVQGGISQDPSHGVLRALQELAAQWKASIVAEGVETAPQLSVIREPRDHVRPGLPPGPAGAAIIASPIDLAQLEASAEPNLAVLAMRARLATLAQDEDAGAA